MADLVCMDLVPEPTIVAAALRACRRVNDYSLTTRYGSGSKGSRAVDPDSGGTRTRRMFCSIVLGILMLKLVQDSGGGEGEVW